jgi:hypothetical protein
LSKGRKSGILGVETAVSIHFEFCPSAFKHGVSEASIRYAFLSPLFDGPTEDADNKYLRIGFDQAGVLLEILYNEVDEQTVNVFHAMKCQSIYYELIKPRGER